MNTKFYRSLLALLLLANGSLLAFLWTDHDQIAGAHAQLNRENRELKSQVLSLEDEIEHLNFGLAEEDKFVGPQISYSPAQEGNVEIHPAKQSVQNYESDAMLPAELALLDVSLVEKKAEDNSLVIREREQFEGWSDEDWSAHREGKITEFLSSNQFPHIQLQNIACKKGVCRIEVKEAPDVVGQGLETLIDTGDIGQGAYFYTNSQGMTVAYVVRDKQIYAGTELQDLENQFQ